MKSKRLQIVLTVLYAVMLILNSSSIILPVNPVSAGAENQPLAMRAAQGGGTHPAICETAGRDPDSSIEAGIPLVTSNSIVFASTNLPVSPGSSNGNPNGERLRMIPGETITFRVRVANSTNQPGRTPTTLTDVDGEIVLAFSEQALPVTWEDPTFTGTLVPGQQMFGTVEYTAQIGDPLIVDYTFYGWGLRADSATPNSGQRCDLDYASHPAVNTEFRVEGPLVGLSLSVNAPDPSDPRIEVGAPIQWTLTITNQRAIQTTISTIDDLFFEANTYGICSPPPGSTLEQLLNTQEGTNVLPATVGSQLSVTFACNMLPAYPNPSTNEVTVQATANTIAGDVTLPFRTSVSVGKATPGISVVKFANVTEATVGDTISYTLRVTNSGDTTLNSVTVVDSLTQLVLNVPGRTLAVDESYEETVDYIVRDSDADPLVNIVTAVGVSPQGTTVSDSWTLSLDKRNPAIELDMSVSPESAAAGETVTYTFQVTNTSNESLVNVRVEFPLCEQPGVVSGCLGNRVLLGTPGAQTVSLLAGATISGTVVYEIQGTENDPFGFSAITTATARALTNAGSTVADSASVYVDILNSAIQIQSEADRATALRGDTIRYTFRVINHSASPQIITSITDSLLGAIGSIPPGGLTLNPGDPPYEFEEYYTVSGSDLDPLINITTVTAEGGITDSTTTVVDISNAQLFITVVTIPPDEQEPPGDVEYRIFISNNGRITLNNVTGYIQFVGTTEPVTPLAIDFPDTPGPTVEAGTLAPFELATSTFIRAVQSDDPDPLTALVRVQGTDDLGLERSFFGSVTINILPTRLQLRKTANATRAGVGDIVTYEFFVRNAADSDIVDISVTDPLCAASMPSSGCDGTTVLLAPYDEATGTTTGAFTPGIDRLQPGEMAYGTFDYVVTNADLRRPERTLTNLGTASGTLEAGSEPVGDASQWDITVVNPLVVEKFANRLFASDGQCVTYSFRVSNIGSLTTIENVALSDNRLGNLSSTFPPFDLTPGNVVTLTDTTATCTGATQHVVTSADIPRLVNVVTATGEANGQILNASDDWAVDVTPPIIVTKSNSTPFFGIAVVGDTVRYRVTLNNVSDSTYSFVSARDVSNSYYDSERTFPVSQLIANSDDPANPALEPGESTWIEYDYEIGPRDPNELVNTFEVAMSSAGTTITFSDTHTIDVYSPFSILKIPSRFFAIVGQTIHYDYLIFNVSQITMTDVTVVDDRLGPIATRLLDPNGTQITGYTTAPRDLPAATEYPCLPLFCDTWLLESNPAENNYTVRPTDLVSETLVNTVTVSGETTIDSREPNVPIITTEIAEVQIANPLRVTKVGPLTASRGETITYSVTITNISPADSGNTITDINVVDIFTGIVPMGFPPDNPPRTLDPGQTATGFVTLTIPQNASDPLVNTITATGTLQIGGESYNLTSIGTASVNLDDPILDVTLTANVETTERLTTVTWSARLVNNGTSDLTNLTYTDRTGVNIGAVCPSDLPAGSDPVFCQWDYTFTLTDPDPYDNRLTVSGATLGGDTITGSDNFIVDLIDPRFRVSKVASPNVAFVGDTITYTITVTNTSDSVLTNVLAYDTLTGPVPLEFPSGINGLLNNNESATAEITYTLSQADPNPLVNEVAASGISAAGGITLEDATYTTVLITSSRLLVNKQASAPIVQRGDTITYNIAITNIGQVPIRNIQVVDEAVGLNTATDPNSCGGTITYGGQTYNAACSVDTPLTIDPIDALNPFEVAFITYSVEATLDLPDPFINAALVSGNDDQGNTIEGSDSIAVDILTPGIRLTKTADRAGAAPNDTVTYTVSLTNTTGGQLTNVQVIDNELGLPVQMSLTGAPFVDTIAVMENGQTAVGIITYTVTRDTPNPFINTVTVTNDQGLTDGAAATVEIRDLGISVTKIPRNPSAVIGDVITYDIEVQNTSSQNLRAVIAIDQLTGTTVPLSDPVTGDTITELAPGATAVGTFTYTIPPDVPDPLVNRVSASGRADSGVFVSSSGLALVDIREADISLNKTASSPIALVGDSVTYNFVVRNEGNATLSAIVLTDPLCATASSGCSSATEVSLTFPTTPGTLASDEEATGQITRQILPGDPDPIINTATVVARTPNGVAIQDTDSATVALATSDLVITKTVLGIGSCAAPEFRTAARIGDIIAYTVSLQNLGTNTISGIQVVDTLNGTDITSQLFPGVVPPATPTLGALGTVSTCVQTQVTTTSPDPLVNTVVASGLLNGVTPISDTASASMPIANSDLLVTNVPSQTSARIGDTIIYTVTVRNTGFDTLDNVRATSPQAGGNITLGTTLLVPGQSTFGTYTYTITGLDADPFLSTVIATAIAPGPITLTDSATARVDLVSDGVRLTKEAAPTFAPAGADIVYTLTVTNTGTEPITAFTVIDQMLGGDITGCFIPGVTLPTPGPACTVPTMSPLPLAPGASASTSIRRALSGSDGDPAVNTAVVTAEADNPANPAEPIIMTDSASASVNVAGNGLTVIKTADVAAAFDGDTVNYTLEIINTSLTPVTGLTVNDTLVSGITLPRYSFAPGERITATYAHTVNALTNPNPLVNQVQVTGRDGVGITVSDTSSATVAILGSDAIRVTVTPDRTTVLANQTINYLTTITNIGTETLTNISAVATLHDGSTIDLTGLLPVTTLAPGSSVSAVFSYTVRDSDRSPVVTTVRAEGTGATAGIVSDIGRSTVTIRISSIRISATPTNCGFPCIGIIGDTIRFTATVRNDGATTLTNVSLSGDMLIRFEETPAGLILAPGQTYTVNFTYTVPLNAPNPSPITLQAQGTDPIGAEVISPSYTYLLATANPRISVTLSPDRENTLDGQAVNYTAEIRNVGSEPLQNLALVDSLVGVLTDSITVSILAPGQTTRVTYSYTPGSATFDPLVNTITVSGQTSFGRAVTDNDTAVVNILRPQLYISLTADRQVAMLGERINYTVSVLNTGDGPINNLRGSYLVDRSITSGLMMRPSEQGGGIILGSTSLPQGVATTGFFSYIPTTGDPNPLGMRAIVTGDGVVGDAVIAVSDSATAITSLVYYDASGNPINIAPPIIGTADPEVVKLALQPFVEPGGLVTWTMTVRNPGTDPLAGVIITDTLDIKMRVVSVAITNGTIQSEGNTIVALTEALDFNETANLTIVARLNEGVIAGALIQNLGCATAVGATASVCDVAVVRVAPDAALLPATGQAAADGGSAAGASPALALAVLLLLGLLGLSMQNPQPGNRLLVFAVLLIAAVVIVAGIVGLIANLGPTPGSQAAETPEETTQAVAQEPTPAVAEPTATLSPGQPTPVPPTPIPIPTAAGPLLPTEVPSGPAPFTPQYERELFIPRLNLNVAMPIVNIPLRNRTWDVRDLGNQVGFLQGTSWLDEAAGEHGGNTVLAGHVQITEDVPGPFRDLDLLEVGDSIFLADTSTIHEFEVYQVDVVAADDVGVTYPTDDQTLTLITCTTWNAFRGVFAERLIVRARPLRSMTYDPEA